MLILGKYYSLSCWNFDFTKLNFELNQMNVKPNERAESDE